MKMKARITDISVAPVKKYAAPKYPTQTDAKFSPNLLRKLPSRWEKNAVVVAAVGMLGMMTLASCGRGEIMGDISYSIPSEQEVTSDVCETEEETFMLEGEVAPPVFATEQDYVETEKVTNFLNYEREKMPVPPGGIGPPAIISEQDALDIIKSMVEFEGLNFESDLSEYSNITNAQIDLYDFGNQVAIIYEGTRSRYPVEKEHTNYDGIFVGRFCEPEINWQNEEQQQIINEFFEKIEDLDYMENPEEYEKMINEVIAQYRINMKPFGEEQIREQVRDFIEWLQGQGII